MSDLEMVKLCAEAMGPSVILQKRADVATAKDTSYFRFPNGPSYDPLHNDAQAMALVKKFKLHPIPDHDREGWWDVFAQRQEKSSVYGSDPDLNRAIVECVAKMQSA